MVITKIKKMLEEEKHQILARTAKNASVDIDIDGDETDEIQGKILALTTNQLLARDKTIVAKIENALRRIEDGSFGQCEECGDEIAEKRLMVNPSFNTCISCAEHLEIVAKRNRV